MATGDCDRQRRSVFSRQEPKPEVGTHSRHVLTHEECEPKQQKEYQKICFHAFHDAKIHLFIVSTKKNAHNDNPFIMLSQQ